jgi:hypothetical protein
MGDDRAELHEHLVAIEAACRGFDAGALDDASRIGEGLAAVFQPVGSTPPLLTRLGGTYTRLASSVPKPPHPQGLFLPLVNVTLEMPGSEGYVVQAMTGPSGLSTTPRCQPRLGRASAFRQVQAPDWWKNEAVFLVDRSKLTRKDVVLGIPDARAATPLIKIPMNYGVVVEVHWQLARLAALRQVAHELLGSPELLKLAGRPGR